MQAAHLSKVGFFSLSSCCRNNPFPIAASELECRRPKICSREQAVVVVVVAGDNKRQPNYIDIGVGSRAACDEVKIVRISSQQPLEVPTNSKSSSRRNPPPLKRRTSLSTVDLKPEQQNLVIEATKRGRGGKTVTVIKGLQLKQDSLDALCKALKMKIGSGGTVKDGIHHWELMKSVARESRQHMNEVSRVQSWQLVHCYSCDEGDDSLRLCEQLTEAFDCIPRCVTLQSVVDGDFSAISEGNHSVMLVDELVKLGFKAKKSGR